MAEIMKMMFLVAFLLLHAESIEGYEFRLLQNNSQDTDGFVEIFYDGSWGLIGNPEFRFSDDTASLLCKKFNLSLFGYGASYMHQENNRFNYSWLQKLECNGNEQSIDECVKTDEFNRIQYIDIGSKLYEYGSKLYCVDYRLIGGLSQNTGMLLAAFNNSQHSMFNNSQHSMCYHGFDSNAGDVVCKHLRYNGLVDFTEGDPGLIPLFNNKLTCTGNESSLHECTMSDDVIDNCTRAVYITCKAVRLTTWNKYNDEGTVDIFYNGAWGLLDVTHGFNNVTAKFLCETFGFGNVGFSTENYLLGKAYHTKHAWSVSLGCNGTEADIMQCAKPSSFIFEEFDWSIFSLFPWLYCFDFNITSMRLVNGLNSNEDVVELQIGGRWGPIAMYHRNTSEFETGVCQFLGYGGDSGILDSNIMDYFKRTWTRNAFCNRNENEIDFYECYDATIGRGDIFLTVKCEDTDQCQSNPCLNNGICVDGDRSYTCTCTERWSGINCEIDTDPCQSNPCLNNGTCVDGDRSYTCNCTERWSGINCELDLDACLPQPCENNGTCVNKINGFECFCADGYEEYRCQNEVGDQQQVGDQTTLIVVLISTICVLSIVVLATVCCCIRYRRKHKKTKTVASKVLDSGNGGMQNTKEVEAIQTEIEEGQCIDDVYDRIKENPVTDVADYINPVTGVELPSDANGYVKFADNDESVGYHKLKHTKTEDYSKLSGQKF